MIISRRFLSAPCDLPRGRRGHRRRPHLGYADEAIQEGLQFRADLIASGASPSTQQLTDTPADQWFTSGKLAMYDGGSWFRGAIGGSDVEADVQVAPLPRGEKHPTTLWPRSDSPG